jgi:hypothetical protein
MIRCICRDIERTEMASHIKALCASVPSGHPGWPALLLYCCLALWVSLTLLVHVESVRFSTSENLEGSAGDDDMRDAADEVPILRRAPKKVTSAAQLATRSASRVSTFLRRLLVPGSDSRAAMIDAPLRC